MELENRDLNDILTAYTGSLKSLFEAIGAPQSEVAYQTDSNNSLRFFFWKNDKVVTRH